MRILNYFFCVLVLSLSPVYGWAKQGERKEPAIPQVSLAVSLERGAVEIGDSIPVVIQLSNPSNIQVSNLRLKMNSPVFVSLHGEPGVMGDSVNLGALPALSGVNREGLRLIISRKALVGDFNLLFTLAYDWTFEGKVFRSQVVTEKPLHIGLLGTDKIIGIPLAFAQFIVPGLFFLSLLGLLKVPFIQALGAQEKLVFSVLVSVCCLFLVDYVGRTSGWNFARQLYRENTISIEKLFYLALSGVVLGLLFYGGYCIYLGQLRKRKARLAFHGGEDPVELVRKALLLNPRYEGQPWRFLTGDNRVYYCAHYFETDSSYILVGAFKIDKESLQREQQLQVDKFCREGEILQTSNNLLKLLRYVKKAGDIRLSLRNPVKREEGGELKDESTFFTISKEEFRSKQHVRLDHMKLIVLN